LPAVSKQGPSGESKPETSSETDAGIRSSAPGGFGERTEPRCYRSSFQNAAVLEMAGEYRSMECTMSVVQAA
jgi:hypothetical protein